MFYKQSIEPKSIERIGIRKEGTNRPIIVRFETVEEKKRVMNNLRYLKGVESFIGISITDDYTVAEREITQRYRQRAKAMNEDSCDPNTVVRVRGCPKTGLYLKKSEKADFFFRATNGNSIDSSKPVTYVIHVTLVVGR